MAKEEAEQLANEMNEEVYRGEYMLDNGQYARPHYEAKIRNKSKDVWGVWVDRGYYVGTLNCPNDGWYE